MFKPEPQKTYEVKYPFCRCVYTNIDEDGYYENLSWRPGIDWKMSCPDDSHSIAHGEGLMFLTVVDVFKPGKYPKRVFYTRKYRDPDGKIFGKGKMHICIIPKFKRLIEGYSHPYELVEYSA